MHLIDGPIVNPVSTDLSFGTINNSWDTAGWTGDPNYWGFWHAAHVAGVVGAKSNNFLLRGINPGQTIMHYGGHSNPYTVADRLNLITAYNELGYLWSVINISMNTGKDIPYTENDFEFQKDLGRMMAIASNTHLIFQSAGNNNDDACKYSFTFNGAARPYDGIMLIGGFDINGRFQQWIRCWRSGGFKQWPLRRAVGTIKANHFTPLQHQSDASPLGHFLCCTNRGRHRHPLWK